MPDSSEERALQEGALSRAWRDTQVCCHHWLFWVAETFGGGVIGMLITPTCGLIFIAAVFVAILVINVALAPRRQRDEARAIVKGLEHGASEESGALNAKITGLGEENARLQRTIAAQEAYTEELYRQREARERELDPFIQAFREARYKEVSVGEVSDEENLDHVFWWINEKSAWVRWQIAQHTINDYVLEGKDLFRIIAVRFWLLLQEGKIIVRACRKGEISYEEIRPDFWKWARLTVNRDPVRIWKVSIVPLEETSLPDYIDPRCSRKRVREIFPESDEQLDALSWIILDEVTAARVSKATSPKEGG